MLPTLAPKTFRNNSYPTTDGRPITETDFHRQLMTDLIQTLEFWYADDPDVYVSGNLLLFYEEGNKRRHISPDVFVVFGVPKKQRPNYLIWEEGRGPAIAIELTSSSTRNEDTRKKLALYRDILRVPEYIMFDPLGDYLKPRFQGYRLVAGEYRPMRLNKDGRLKSRQLGLLLVPDRKELRLVDPTTGIRLLTPNERWLAAERARKEAEESASAVTSHRERVEAENIRLRAELAAMRNPGPSRNGH